VKTFRKFLLVASGAGAVLILAAFVVGIDGPFRPIEPLLTVQVAGSAGWFPVVPVLVSNGEDPGAIYVVRPDSARGREFDAVRVDLANGRQTPASVPLGPDSSYRPLLPAEVGASVAGLRFDRPAFHLFSLPDGKGPGIHRVDSATGKIEIAIHSGGARHPILKGFGVNTNGLSELASRIFVDPGKGLCAVTLRERGGLALHVFEIPSPSVDPVGNGAPPPQPSPAT